jgi:hypothetical protein
MFVCIADLKTAPGRRGEAAGAGSMSQSGGPVHFFTYAGLPFYHHCVYFPHRQSRAALLQEERAK